MKVVCTAVLIIKVFKYDKPLQTDFFLFFFFLKQKTQNNKNRSLTSQPQQPVLC